MADHVRIAPEFEPAERILVVDDNRINRLTLVRAVEELDYRVGAVDSGEEALALLTSEPFDAVLLDLVMPTMDGFEVLERLRSDPDLRDIPVIIVSAVEEAASVARGIELGALDHLPKPFEPAILRARLRAGIESRRLRALERAYVEQESALRDSEKLAALGRLTAGLAHEINNPAAAARRAAHQLGDAIGTVARGVAGMLTTSRGQRVGTAVGELIGQVPAPVREDPLARAKREEALEDWLTDRGIRQPWEVAGRLVDAGLGIDALEELAGVLDPDDLGLVVELVVALRTLSELSTMIVGANSRVSDLVGSLKTYTRMDEAPLNDVDVHEGLDSTLIMLQREFGAATVRRDYAPDLPRITAYGSELNQVWTNLLDNAADAIAGSADAGTVMLRTRVEDDEIVVEVEDDGPGIAPEVDGRIFDPFVTSKPPGAGAGLGLSIVHRIVTARHGGHIEVDSVPGRTCFRVRLPMHR